MAETKGDTHPSTAGRESIEVLRAKYLDYCSAQVAEIVLRLSPDEIFVLAREEARGSSTVESLSYDSMVQLATVRIYQKLDLPGFQEWAEEYRRDPARFDAELLGLWETDVGSEEEG